MCIQIKLIYRLENMFNKMVDLFNCHVKTINKTELFYIIYSNFIWLEYVQIQNSSQNCMSINIIIITLHNYSVYKLPSYFHAFTFSLNLKSQTNSYPY